MNIKFLGHLKEKFEDFTFNCSDIKGVFSAIGMLYSETAVNELINMPLGYVLGKSTSPEEFISLISSVIFTDFGQFDEIYIIPEISGDFGIDLALVAIIVAVVSVVASLVIALTMGSPNREITNQITLQSNLFGTAPLIRDQGGVLPIIYGSPFCGGVLISSGLYTTTMPGPAIYLGGPIITN